MRIPSWAMVAVALLASLPFGWALGVFAAVLIAGPEFGQLPVMTVPLGILVAILFALAPSPRIGIRLGIMIVGTGLFLLLG